MLTGQTLLYVVYVLVAAAAILAIEAFYLSFARRRARSGIINRRLKRLAEDAPAEETLKGLLRERGLSETGDFAFGAVALNRLYTQSGVTGNPIAFLAVFAAIGAVTGLGMRIFAFSSILSFLTFLFIAFALPWLHLKRKRKKRITRFERQLPDALDMIVRSLRAGHPTTVAVGLVSREMPDPLGTEFGIVSDEITFGLSLEQAVRKLAERVGFEGLNLLAVSLSIQAKTGGNLTEILANLSKVLRERWKMRLKIRALSAEGRVSAWMISGFPLVMFGLLMLITPSYYGDIWDNPAVMPTLVIFGGWALLGDFIMYRMVNFDY
ncbi:type II secretion system F family protein [Nitratireductor luteus]|uniref:type II secretion system F family protein n=1 Tax=Nitratireductor luteus TaxID=2976980 RepID=UPI00223F4BCD|nr:type II secretion system F family protein [Nitratireductor luteus]